MNLDKIKAYFPDFQIGDFDMFDQIISLKWERIADNVTWEEYTSLKLKMTCPGNYTIGMEFIGVNSLYFQGNGQISGFYIKDMAVRGYESCSKYEVGDYEEGDIRFYCSDIVILFFEKTEG